MREFMITNEDNMQLMAMNKKSLLDRDNLDLFIVDEESQEMIAEVLLEENGWVDVPTDVDELPKLQPWQEEILNKEFGDGE